ncbi:MAG: hypothetical protein DDT31_01018 [Syntrophomonadaceae bacterium]|nr:hypothetical protein [Bacillota bacterium]
MSTKKKEPKAAEAENIAIAVLEAPTEQLSNESVDSLTADVQNIETADVEAIDVPAPEVVTTTTQPAPAAIEVMQVRKFNTLPPLFARTGKVFTDSPVSTAEAIEAAGLDFHVQQSPLQAVVTPIIPEGVDIADAPASQVVQIAGQFANVRTDNNTVLGIVTERYKVLQNREAFAWFDTLIFKGQAQIVAAGSFENGSIIYVVAKLPGRDIVGGVGDILERYVILTHSHDGSKGINITPLTLRLVCMNGLQLPVKGETLNIRHTTSMDDRMLEAGEAIRAVTESFDKYREVFNAMAETKVSNEQADKFFTDFLGIENQRNREAHSLIRQAYLTGPGAELESARGTVFGLVNAATYYNNSLKLAGGKTKTAEGWAKAAYTSNGSVYRANELALNLGVALVN